MQVIIPVCNEEEAIPGLLEKIKGFDVIFVDDGSTDNTYELIKNYNVIRHETNQGIGAAIKSGLTRVTSDKVAVLDSDCSYDPQLLNEMSGIDSDLVTASPYHPKGRVEGVNLLRVLLSKSCSLLYSYIIGKKVYTFTSIVRVYKTDVLRRLEFSSGFISLTEIIVDAIKKGYSVFEYPAVLKSRTKGKSKMKIIKVIKTHLNFMWSVMED